MIRLFYGFASALIFMVLPWGIPFLIDDVGTVLLPVSAFLSLGALLFLLSRNLIKGDFPAATGVLMVPLAAWLLFNVNMKWPAQKAIAKCHFDATEIQKARNPEPKKIVLENITDDLGWFNDANVSTALAVLTNAEVLWTFQSNARQAGFTSEKAAELALCRIAREDMEPGYWTNRSHTDKLRFDQKQRKLDRCIVKRNADSPLDYKNAVFFRQTEIGGGCFAIDVFERDASGSEMKLGRAKYDRLNKKLSPELRRQGDPMNDGPLFLIARSVLGETISVGALRQHLAD